MISSFLVFLTRIGGFVFFSKSMRISYVSFIWTYSGLCAYYLLVWSNFNPLHSSWKITFPAQSYQLCYSFCASLLWLTVIYLFPYNLYLLFFSLLSIFDSTWLVFTSLFCIPSHVEVISLLWRLKYSYNCFYYHIYFLDSYFLL